MKKSTFPHFIVSFIFTIAIICLANVGMTFAQVKAWGRNSNGRLGLGHNITPQANPQTIPNSADITALSAGATHALALKADGTVLAWGNNGTGQLGNGGTGESFSPAAVLNLTDATAVAASDGNSLALLSDGTVMVWGSNEFGQLGNGTTGGLDVYLPQTVAGLSNVVAIAANGFYNLALKSDGTVWAWGRNERGQLGLDTSGIPVSMPTQIPNLTDVVSIAAGELHAAALKRDGTVHVWGYNFYGQIGDGSVNDTGGTCQCNPTPTQSSISNVVQIAAGVHHTVALKNDGSVFSWGWNNYGVIGNNTFGAPQNYSTPIQSSISDVVDIKAKGRHTLARKRDGTVWAWGFNLNGSIGDGSSGNAGCQCKPVPTQSNVGLNNALIETGRGDQSFTAIPLPTTPVGNNMRLRGENINLNFSTVLSAGQTLIAAIDPTSTGYTVPQDYTIVPNAPGYQLTTTADTGGNSVTVCLRVSTVFDMAQFSRLSLMHGEGSALVDRTTTRNYQRREVCGAVTSFSPFVIAVGPVAPTSTTATLGGRVTIGKRGIRNVLVKITESDGTTRTILSGRNGRYEFTNVEVGQSIIVTVRSKRFVFAPNTHVVYLLEDLDDLNFTGQNGGLSDPNNAR